jgi:hypothetical protein
VASGPAILGGTPVFRHNASKPPHKMRLIHASDAYFFRETSGAAVTLPTEQ